MSWMTTSEHAGRRQCLSAGVDGVNHELVSQNKSERIDGILIVINDEDSKRVVVLASVICPPDSSGPIQPMASTSRVEEDKPWFRGISATRLKT